ncbi:MAG: heme-binding protein [Alphaproteobacteria bacterium]|nr:heme-binding protein [Alphaproteobacteria bacterium]
MRKLALAAVILAASGHGAAAQDAALVTLKVMTPETALTLAQAALKDCRGRGYQVAVAVVDRFGNLQVMLRDRFAGPHTPETARRKAWTAVSFRTDTLSMADFTEAGKEASGVRFVDQALMVGGGATVEAAGSIVGGVGVSGAPGGAADDACARVGIAAIQEDLDF